MERVFLIWILIFTIILSVITLILFGVDKRRAVRHQWRIPEAVLLLFSFLFGGIGGLLGMKVFHHKTRKWKFRILVPLFAVLQVLILIFLLWTAYYYPADSTAMAAMTSDNEVQVESVSSGWLFDGPSEDTAYIFYPGAKVEAGAYAPLLREIASSGADVYLVEMPLNLAFFRMNRAEDIISRSDYSRYYVGGHSLGGAMAANYAASHDVAGVILLAAYPVKELDEDTLLLYGSEDTVVNREKIAEAQDLVLGEYMEYEIDGGNHAQFGNYGAQKGDGQALITVEEQQRQAVERIMAMMEK